MSQTLVEIRKCLTNHKLEDARAQSEAAGWILRVVVQDGEPYIVTCDHVPNRINVVVNDGRIAEVKGIG